MLLPFVLPPLAPPYKGGEEIGSPSLLKRGKERDDPLTKDGKYLQRRKRKQGALLEEA
jgi:hypothetical protein